MDDPSFIHIENIVSRSQPIGWEIRPHRHGRMFQLLLMVSGELNVQLDDTHHRRESACVVLIPAGVVHGFRFSPGTEGLVLTLAEPLLIDEGYDRSKPYFEPLFSAPRIIDMEIDSGLFAQMKGFLQQIEFELTQSYTGRALMCQWLARAVLMTLRRQLDLSLDKDAGVASEASVLVRYRQLIEQHYREQWSVDQYAVALGVTADRLNRLCKKEIGRNAKTLPLARLLLEAKRRLIYTRSALDEIAYDLGFKDPAYFSRFFKREAGTTPGRFRSENNFETTEA